MMRKYLLPAGAVVGLAVCVLTVAAGRQGPPAAKPAGEPGGSPFAHYVAGSGIVEAQSENIQVGNLVAGVVTHVCAAVGEHVQKGQALWEVDDRELRAQLLTHRAAVGVEEAQVAAAEAKLERLRQMPRPEEIPPAQARAEADLHSLADARDQLNLAEAAGPGAVAAQEMDQKRHAVEVAEARGRASAADLALLKAGAWGEDMKIAHAEIAAGAAALEAARAQVEADEALIGRLTVRSPVDGQVLQAKVHAGEFAPADRNAALMYLGDTSRLMVRVDVDENDAWRVPRGDDGGKLKAIAYLKGNTAVKCDLQFLRIEPFVIPKKSLTGDTTERVDTRVLQVLYTIDRTDEPIYVGQQMDAFLETRE